MKFSATRLILFPVILAHIQTKMQPCRFFRRNMSPFLNPDNLLRREAYFCRPRIRGLSSGKLYTSPGHIAVIMDGNRRYGKAMHGNSFMGHMKGTQVLCEFVKWCKAENIKILTVFAFSTENWNREQSEIDELMNLFCAFLEKVINENPDISVKGLITLQNKLPEFMMTALQNAEQNTFHCQGLKLNICLSYGSRDEIAKACKAIVKNVQDGKLSVEDIDENTVKSHLLTGLDSDPDILIRTSGEQRISNFLLFQLAYTEFFFLQKTWPEITQDDLKAILLQFSERHRRFGL